MTENQNWTLVNQWKYRCMDDHIKTTILEVSLRLFQRFGYKKTTIEEIAREAGIGKGSVYLHFQSKEDVLLTLIREHLQLMIEDWIRIVHKDWPVFKKVSTMLKSCIVEIQRKKEELSLSMLPPPLVQSVLKMSEETRAQELTLLNTVLDPVFQAENFSFTRDKLARVLLEITNNIIFRLDLDKQFRWEGFLDDTLELLFPKKSQ